MRCIASLIFVTVEKGVNKLNEIQFKDYEKLAYKRAHYYADKWHLDTIDCCLHRYDLISMSYVIFNKCIKRFDGRSKFSTYFYHSLKTLNNYCKAELKYYLKGRRILSEELFEDTHEVFDITYLIIKNVSEDTCKLLHAILQGTFLMENPTRQTDLNFHKIQTIIKNDKNWNGFKFRKAWKELSYQWREICQ